MKASETALMIKIRPSCDLGASTITLGGHVGTVARLAEVEVVGAIRLGGLVVSSE